jgi:hypothetical protein
MAMLNGFIGSFIATLENGILGEIQNYLGKVTLNGQDYIDWRKFTCKDFFSGMWHRLKTGLKDAANQLLRYLRDLAFGSGPSTGASYKSGALPLFGAILPGFGFIMGPH